ncbi:CHAP domain-containing protein [Solihabitans fulvus]|nr:CHAP domain-containing protein [Solihabitans fulvus]
MLTWRSSVLRMLGAALIGLVALMAVPVPALAGTDDYPAEWRNAAQDSRIDSWGYYNRECTSFVAWRLHARNGFEMPRAIGNAGTWGSWFSTHGYAVNGNPAAGSIAESSGHVAWVEAVNGDGTITIEDYNYNYQGTYGERRVAVSAYNYIHAKDIDAGGGTTDGAFVRDADTSAVYRIVGGAPVYVSTWDGFGGAQPATNLSHSAILALPQYPRDGTFVVGTSRGEVYRFAGGAPLYVSTWSAFGGPQAVTAVDQAAIDNAGGIDVWSHVRATPADGTFVAGVVRHEVYRFAGGAPLYVSTWSVFGSPQPTVGVDDAALDNAGSGGVWNHVNAVPADGTLVNGSPTGQVYRFAGGAPLYVSSWSAIGGPQPSTTVDQAALDNAGGASPWGHAHFYPADGTLVDTQDGRVWQVLAHVAHYVHSWDEVGGPKPTTHIDLADITNAGQSGVWSHLAGSVN